MSSTLYYVHDPMCSWCWGFKPALDELLKGLPDSVRVQRILGGLAPDSDQPMPEAMQQMLQQTWQQIQSVIPGTSFNYDFWTRNQPRRSTWPSCRAVLAARRQNEAFEVPMILAIQRAYYLDARNPSDTQTLIDIATEIGCDADGFSEYLHSEAAHRELETERNMAQQLQVQGFPSLIYRNDRNQLYRIPVNYNQAAQMLEQITQANAA
ncbi:DsbA family protein [Granulosicoccus sp. 3-233]|uniref:DsbA family protein n=1 Tax=Granulosicoccus sp. 3-233 TaxID=3417969 RepID=UPI003D35179E